MATVSITNTGEADVAVLVGDPNRDGPHTVHRLKFGQSANVQVDGNPDAEKGTVQVVGITLDGPWTDDVLKTMSGAAELEGHDGSQQ